MKEIALAQAWASGRWGQLEPADTAIEVIYPGRRQRTSGPDFIDAVVKISGHRLTGAVEIHVNASDWRTHRHHLDPAYNNTVLHVVLNNDSALPVITADGKTVTQVCLSLRALNNYVPPGLTPFPCRRGNDAVSTVEEAGMARFEMKIQRFTNDLRFQPPNEAVYCGIAIALGYQENRTPMQILAEAMTLADIENGQFDRHPESLEALILRNAGLLTGSSGEIDTEARRLWRLLPGGTNTPILNRSHWRFTHVRPVNSPVRRLAALARLIHRYSARQLGTGLLEPLHGEHPMATAVQLLEESLTITASGYWADHSDFGRLLPGSYALLGAERASAIAANVILPFACASGRATSNTSLTGTAIGVYRTYPTRCGNEITRYMSQLLLLPVKTACGEQGLIHLYRNWCREKRCRECPVSGKKPEVRTPGF